MSKKKHKQQKIKKRPIRKIKPKKYKTNTKAITITIASKINSI